MYISPEKVFRKTLEKYVANNGLGEGKKASTQRDQGGHVRMAATSYIRETITQARLEFAHSRGRHFSRA